MYILYEIWESLINLSQLTILTNPTGHLSHIPQYTILNRNVNISVMNDVLWDMGRVPCGICDNDLLNEFERLSYSSNVTTEA